MKQLFLRPVTVKEYTEQRDNIIHKVSTSDENEMQIEEFDGWYDEAVVEKEEGMENELFSDEDYVDNRGKSKVDVEVKTTDKFKGYTFSTNYMVTLKQATVSTEARTPFVVAKTVNKKSRVEENDTIYKTDYKIKNNEKATGKRLGFIEGATSLNKARYNLTKTNMLVGIVNDVYPIRKKKRFNQKKAGYIKLSESTAMTDYFVEITQSRGYLWMMCLALIITAALILISGHDWSGWKLDPSNLNLFKTQEVSQRVEKELQISHLDGMTMSNKSINLGLESSSVDDLSYKASVYLEDNTMLFESGIIDAGQGIESIEINKLLETGEYKCIIKCDVYKKGSNTKVTTLESIFTVSVK